jgi:hypothetical protein
MLTGWGIHTRAEVLRVFVDFVKSAVLLFSTGIALPDSGVVAEAVNAGQLLCKCTVELACKWLTRGLPFPYMH